MPITGGGGSASLDTSTLATFTEGSILFVASDGTLQEDNTNLKFNDTSNTLTIRNITGVDGATLAISSQPGDSITITATDPTVDDESGGGITLTAGTGKSLGAGGSLTLAAGNGSGGGGSLDFTAGHAGWEDLVDGSGGHIYFTAGDGYGAGLGGDIKFTAGNAAGAGNSDGGDVQFIVGNKTGSGTKGTFRFTNTGSVDGVLDFESLSAGRTFTFPDETGTVALNAFKTIAVSGQSNVVADSATDTLTLAAGSNITITTNATTDTVTIEASGGAGGVSESLAIAYAVAL